jgi:allantoicase
MATPVHDPEAPDFVRRSINLADARLGAVALAASDEFFAAKERMLAPEPAVFVPGKYDANGKWMDGWESRRRRGPGHDWCVVRLARPGTLIGVDLDTSHFTGNFPPAVSLECCSLAHGDPGADTRWQVVLPATNLGPSRHHYLALDTPAHASHVRVNLHPDGGLARLRLYGRPDFDPRAVDAAGRVDLAAALQGATILAANNEHFGAASNLLLPGRGSHMGDGWETRRRREPGNDWCIVALARPGRITAVEVDTAHFKGNYPDRCSLRGALVAAGTPEAIVTQAMFWPQLLGERKLEMDRQHSFDPDAASSSSIVSHVRFDIFPDGGVSRLRLFGQPV